MQLSAALAFAVVAASAAPTAVAAQDWQLDKSHSTIGFTVRHLGFAKVNGRFKRFDAQVQADSKTGKITALSATAQAASVDTDNAKRDKHLRSDDFFAAKKHPMMKLKLKSIKWQGNAFTAKVALTLRGVTKTVTFKGELLGKHKVNFGSGDQLRVGYEAEASINRKDFGLKFGKVAEGVSVVSDTVKIKLDAEFSKAL
ncbi:MAG: YceI family protein [Polyangiales bacterium]